MGENYLRPTQVGEPGKIRFKFREEDAPYVGDDGVDPGDVQIFWCDVGATSFTDITADGGGASSTIEALGSGWYQYTYLASRVTNPGEVIFAFHDDGGGTLDEHVLCLVGSLAADGRLAAHAEVVEADAIDADSIKADAVTKLAAGVFATVIEHSQSFGNIVRLMTGIVSGKSSGYNVGNPVFKSLNDAKTRATFTTDATGRLTLTLGDLT